MISGDRKKLLEVFFERPLEKFYLRELARRAKIPVNSTHKYLNEFLEKELVKARKLKRRKFFKVNLQNEFLLKIFEYFEVERRETFLQEMSNAHRLKKITQDILEVMKDNVIIIYNRSNWEIFLIATYEKESIPSTNVITTLSLKEFEAKVKNRDFFSKIFRDRVVLYNEFLFWRELSKFNFF